MKDDGDRENDGKFLKNWRNKVEEQETMRKWVFGKEFREQTNSTSMICLWFPFQTLNLEMNRNRRETVIVSGWWTSKKINNTLENENNNNTDNDTFNTYPNYHCMMGEFFENDEMEH